MRIVITRAKSAFSVDGISFFIWELSNELISQGHEVFVISGYNDGNLINVKEMFEIENLPKVICLNQKPLNEIKLQSGMKIIYNWLCHGSKILHKIMPDMIICNEAMPLIYPNFKVVVCHDLEYRFPGRKIYDKIFYRLYNRVITTSEELRRNVMIELRIKPNKIAKIPLCINTKKYLKNSIDERDHAILHVGTWKDKNLQTTLAAFQLLATKDQRLKLFVVGDIWSWPRRLLSSIDKRIRKRIICLGRVSKKELRVIYSKVKVVCVPSNYRVPVLSPTVLEALASGTPVVGSSTGISKDILIHGYNGFRIPPMDHIQTAEKILSLIKDDGLWSEMSRNALKISELFSPSKVARMYFELYNNV